MSLRPPFDIPKDLREFQRWCLLQQRQGYVTVTLAETPYTIADEDLVLVDDDTVGGAVTVNLPPALYNENREIVIKKLGTAGSVTVDGNVSETIDGATTNVLSSQYDALRIVCDGVNWHVIGT